MLKHGVTRPAFRGARVKKSVAQTDADYTTATAITWDAEDFDTDTLHDNVTNNSRFTIPAGVSYVEIGAHVNANDVTSGLFLALTLRKDGSTNIAIQRISTVNATNNLTVTSGPIAVAANEYYEAVLQVQTDTSINVGTTSAFWIRVLQ